MLERACAMLFGRVKHYEFIISSKSRKEFWGEDPF